jgi:protein-L-isoaspartate(D-aspartate) O-methyltransferase
MPSISEFRRFYAEFIVKSADVESRDLVAAFSNVPREEFLGPGPWLVNAGASYIPTISDDPSLVYQDILIGLAPERGINNGQPSLHAQCMALAAPAAGESVVHVGAGTGYYSAVLASLVGPGGKVIAFEREKDLAARAATALRGYPNVEVRHASATEDLIPTCDVLYVSAGVTHPPSAWLDALRVGGRLVFPLTPNEGAGVMLLLTRRTGSVYAARAFSRVAFIPCIGARDEAASASLEAALRRQSLKEVRSLVRTSEPDCTAWCSGSGWWLSTAAPME